MSEQDMLQDLLGDEYLLNWVVGNGGMSTVWLADDIENEREVAVKVLRPEFSDNVEFLSRFRNEALASEDIRNDNVVETYNYKEVTDDSGRTFCFIVMEFIRGESLADMLIRKGSLLEPDALDILEQAAHGLAAIHERGLVHRDIKPGNLLITQNGKVKITDFGIAKAAAAALDAATLGSEADETRLLYQPSHDAEGAYPIVLVSYLAARLRYDDAQIAAVVKAYLRFAASTRGQDASTKATGCAPITRQMREKINAAIDKIAA